MIPYVFKISQLLGSTTKVLLIIMLLFGLVLSEDSCSPGQSVKAKSLFYNKHEKFLAVENQKIVTTVPGRHTMYTITDTDRNSSDIFIFDPQAKRFICMANRKRGIKFVPRIVPKPKMCMFKELPGIHGYVKYALASNTNITLKFNKRGQQHNRHNNRHNHRHKRRELEDQFVATTDAVQCRFSTKKFCNHISYLKKKHNVPKKILDVC